MNFRRSSYALAAALMLLASAASAAPGRRPGVPAAVKTVLPWIEDDYARAVELARARHVPIFVEVWAPW